MSSASLDSSRYEACSERVSCKCQRNRWPTSLRKGRDFLKGKCRATETPEDIEFYGRQNNITCIQQALTVNYIYPSFMATFIFRDLSSCTLQRLRGLRFSVCSNNIHFSHGPCTIWMTRLKHSEGHHTYTVSTRCSGIIRPT